MDFTSFPSRQPVSSSSLPLTLLTLNDWTLVNVVGQDSEKYLQGKVTADVKKMTCYQHLLVAHCDPRGKLLSNLRLFRRGNGFSFIERCSVRDVQLAELKKYSLFSRVEFTSEENLVLLGIAGLQARVSLKNQFRELPDARRPLINDGITSLLWFEFPLERFLLVTDKITAYQIIESLKGKVQFNDSQQWLALDIEAGIPIIDLPNVKQFIPQAINLQALGGISFEKGCYIGQEIVARTRFRGTNKRALWCLTGTANRIPEVGECLELQIDHQNWHRVGIILAAVKIQDDRLLIQAVIRSDLKQDSVLRISGDCTNTLNIKSLPYSLAEE